MHRSGKHRGQEEPGAMQQMTRLLDVDHGLSEAVGASARADALAAVIAPVVAVEAGPWKPLTLVDSTDAFGVLVIAGLIASHVAVGMFRGIEFLGPGDLLHPCSTLHVDV